MGPEVDKMASVMRDALARNGLIMKSLPVGYRAASTHVLLPSPGELLGLSFGGPPALAALLHYKIRHLDKYLQSISDGIQVAVGEANAMVANCPGTWLVMAGYSQGAMVVHRAELRLRAAGRTDVLRHIVGALLLGDGDRASHSRAKLFGTASQGGKGIRAFLQGNQQDVRNPKNTANICNKDDIVCDFHLGVLLHPFRAVDVHTSYAETNSAGYAHRYSPLLTNAAMWLTGKIVKKMGVVFDGSPGTNPPPSALGPYLMTQFGADPQPTGIATGVVDAAGTLSFASALDHELVGEGWLTWSHGYGGDVYMSDGSHTATVLLPPGTRAFYLYAEPDIFEDFNVSAMAGDGTSSGPVTVYGESGAKYFGFYATGSRELSSITVTADDVVAIGEFGIAR
jgi:hypothetical protein